MHEEKVWRRLLIKILQKAADLLRIKLCILLFPILKCPQPALLIDVHILLRLKSSFSNMFLVRAFRAHQREQVPTRLVNVDMIWYDMIWYVDMLMLFRWIHVVLLTLQQEVWPENSDFLELNDKVLVMELFIVLLKPQG